LTFQHVKSIISNNNVAQGVVLENGTEVRSKVVLSNATPKVTFLDLLTEVRKLFNASFDCQYYFEGLLLLNIDFMCNVF